VVTGGFDPLPIIDVAPVGAACVEPVVVVDQVAVAGFPKVALALDVSVRSVGGGALALVGSCAGGLLDPAHAAEQMAQVTAMMVVFMSIPLVLSRGGLQGVGPAATMWKDPELRHARGDPRVDAGVCGKMSRLVDVSARARYERRSHPPDCYVAVQRVARGAL
jgi:hypothetical protein